MALWRKESCVLSISRKSKDRKMSFSQSVKEEIFKNIKKLKGCCATSFLVAVLKSIGSLCVDSEGYGFSVESDNGDLLEFCTYLAHTQFGLDSVMYEIRSAKDLADKSSKYVCKFDVELGKKLGLVKFESDFVKIVDVPAIKLNSSCCRRTFMQALFLSCGSVTVPQPEDMFLESKHSNYHLELRFVNEEFAKFVAEQFSELQFRQTARKNITVLYIKDSERIADFFVFTDAINAKFQLEDIIISRSYRNTANRQRNCIDSNIDRAVAAGSKQVTAIEKIQKNNRFQTLPQNLKDVALARLENPDANLAELAALVGISKSGVNHRLAKLLDIANDLPE